MKLYRLLNPYVTGSINLTVESSSPKTASKHIYSTLNQYFKNHIPKFSFTITDGTEFYHYEVEESRNGNEVITNYKQASINKNLMNDFLHYVNEKDEYLTELYNNSDENLSSITGGKKSSKFSLKDDSSSSSSDDNRLKYRPSKYYYPPYLFDPILEFWYYPDLYLTRHFFFPYFHKFIPHHIKITLGNTNDNTSS